MLDYKIVSLHEKTHMKEIPELLSNVISSGNFGQAFGPLVGFKYFPLFCILYTDNAVLIIKQNVHTVELQWLEL